MKAYEVRETTGLDGLTLNGARTFQQPGHGQIRAARRGTSTIDQGVIKGAAATPNFQ